MMPECDWRVGRWAGPPTVLGDEGDAAVHDDGDVVAAQLLFPQAVPLPARRPLDVGVPQSEVGPAHALQVEGPDRGVGGGDG